MQRPTILAVAGSLREHSYTRRVLMAAVAGAREASAEVTVADLRDYPMPIYDPDGHAREGFDARALDFQGLVAGHDGFLIATPEHNGSLSSALKNAIDWASRPSDIHARPTIFQGKVAAIVTASPGRFGGVRSLAHLRGVLTSVGVHVLPTEIAVPLVDTMFDGDDRMMTDAETRRSLERLGASLADAVTRVRAEVASRA